LQDQVPLNMEALCTPTSDPGVGSTCSLATTADSVIPGMVREGRREIWEMSEPVRVFDAGTDANGVDATLYLTQGLFVP